MWEDLSSLIKSTKYVRCYDGFMGMTTSDVLKGLGILDAAVVRMPDYIPNNGRTMIVKLQAFEYMRDLLDHLLYDHASISFARLRRQRWADTSAGFSTI
jgi:hypothetical protein